MIRHCVLVKFRAGTTEADKQAIYAKLDGLRESIAGIVGAAFGPNNSPEGKGRGFEDGFIMDFENAAARDGYLDDPDHRKVGQELVGMLEGGLEGLLVFDLET